MFDSFRALGVEAEPVVFSDDKVEAIREQLLGLDGVLVWVNPIEKGLDRSKLDPLLREVGEEGVWVSAHPDVILRMATKRVLIDTAQMSWSAPTHLYATHDQLRAELPDRLDGGPSSSSSIEAWEAQASGRWSAKRRARCECSTLRREAAPRSWSLTIFCSTARRTSRTRASWWNNRSNNAWPRG